MPEARTRFLVYCAVFLALSIIFSFFSIYFGPALKVSLAPAVIIFSGIVLGPAAGAVIGAASDVLVLLIKALPGAYFPGFTVTLAVYGLLGGFLYRTKSHERPGVLRIICSTTIIETICSVLMNTGWLVILTGSPFGALLVSRLPLSGVSDALYCAILYILVRYQDRIIRRPVTTAR